MRIQPHKDQKQFIGKKLTESIAISYIGSHRIVGMQQEKTVAHYIEEEKWINHSHIASFITMFPHEIQNLAEFYLLKILQERMAEE